MLELPDLRRDDHHVGSFDKDIPGIPSSTLRIEQEGRAIVLTYVAYENDVEVMRNVYRGTLTHWFPQARRVFVRLSEPPSVMSIDTLEGWYRFDLDPAAYVAQGLDGIAYDDVPSG